MFWLSNLRRELYGTPKKAEATRESLRMQKSMTELIRDGQMLRFLKEAYLPGLKKFWNELEPFDRRYSIRVTLIKIHFDFLPLD